MKSIFHDVISFTFKQNGHHKGIFYQKVWHTPNCSFLLDPENDVKPFDSSHFRYKLYNRVKKFATLQLVCIQTVSIFIHLITKNQQFKDA